MKTTIWKRFFRCGWEAATEMKKLLIILTLALTLSACEPVEKHRVTCKVLSIDKQVKQSGSADSFSTEIYWLVTTDNGTYHIKTDGLWACPEAVGQIKPDSTYTLTVDGFCQSSFWGIYPYIVKVDKP